MQIILTEKTYKNICYQWVKTILHLSESEISIWPPLSGGTSLAHKFSKDTALQQELFARAPIKIIFIDFNQSEHISYEQFEQQCKISLGETNTNFSFDSFLASHENELFGICVMGMDKALDQLQTDTLKEIGTLLEKHTHLSLILLTETNFAEAPFFQDLISKVVLIGNLAYQPLFSFDDSVAYLSGLEEQWSISLPTGYKQILAENIGGHLFLLEEAVRVYRDNPTFGFKEILSSHTLVTKAIAIFNELSSTDQKTIKEVVCTSKKTPYISEYLKQTNLVTHDKVGLQYWQYLKKNLSNIPNPFSSMNKQTIQLTYSEEKLLDQLKQNADILSRENVAKILWAQSEKGEKYSDWAIDQAMHRLREKASQLGCEIKTIKGKGFSLSKIHKKEIV